MEHIVCGFREIKLAPPESGTMTFSGYGAVFDNVDAYGDAIAPGAFADTIAQAKASGVWPAMLEQHGGWGLSASDMTPIGLWTELSEDAIGLKVAGKFAPTTRGQEMHKLMTMEPRPAINGLSIGFVPIKWRNRANPDEPRRTLESVKLMEISPVTFPANPKARVTGVKSLAEIESLADAEALLRDLGMSKQEAVAFVTTCKNIGRSDSGRAPRSDSGLGEAAAWLNGLAAIIKPI